MIGSVSWIHKKYLLLYVVNNDKKCLDCKANVIDDLESEMENEVPMWYKKAGNYSLLPKLLNCEDKYNPNKNDLVEKTPDISRYVLKPLLMLK